jgi:hypothetical protein
MGTLSLPFDDRRAWFMARRQPFVAVAGRSAFVERRTASKPPERQRSCPNDSDVSRTATKRTTEEG